MTDENNAAEELQGEVLPEENADATSEAESSTATADAAEESQEQDEESKGSNKVQERINKITRDKYDAIRKAEEADRKAKELEQKLSSYENQIPASPDIDDYDSTAEYEQAVREHERKKLELESKKTTSIPEQDNSLQKSIEKVKAVVTQKAAEIPGLAEIVSDQSLPIDADIIEYLADSDKAAEVLFHLGNHLDQAFDIHQMTPSQKFRALSKLESTLEAPKPNKVSNAPPPPDPIGNSDGSPVSDEDLSVGEWISRRNAKVYGGS